MGIWLKTSLLVGILAVVCIMQTGSAQNSKVMQVVHSDYLPVSMNQEIPVYFPPSADGRVDGIDSFRNEWYSAQLAAMNEPVLWQSSNSKLVFRFLYLPSFCDPITIRMVINSDKKSGILYYKRADNADDPGKVIESRYKEISEKQILYLYDVIERENFWSLPIADNNDGLDGSEWIIEGTAYGKYHVVDRWCPESNSPVYNIAKIFKDLITEYKYELFDE